MARAYIFTYVKINKNYWICSQHISWALSCCECGHASSYIHLFAPSMFYDIDKITILQMIFFDKLHSTQNKTVLQVNRKDTRTVWECSDVEEITVYML